jgi:hypothetical protein
MIWARVVHFRARRTPNGNDALPVREKQNRAPWGAVRMACRQPDQKVELIDWLDR